MNSHIYETDTIKIVDYYDKNKLFHNLPPYPSVTITDKITGIKVIEYYTNGEPINGPEGYHQITRDANNNPIGLIKVAKRGFVLYFMSRTVTTTTYYKVALTGDVKASPSCEAEFRWANH
jgi:hypothetical protein